MLLWGPNSPKYESGCGCYREHQWGFHPQLRGLECYWALLRLGAFGKECFLQQVCMLEYQLLQVHMREYHLGFDLQEYKLVSGSGFPLHLVHKRGYCLGFLHSREYMSECSQECLLLLVYRQVYSWEYQLHQECKWECSWECCFLLEVFQWEYPHTCLECNPLLAECCLGCKLGCCLGCPLLLECLRLWECKSEYNPVSRLPPWGCFLPVECRPWEYYLHCPLPKSILASLLPHVGTRQGVGWCYLTPLCFGGRAVW